MAAALFCGCDKDEGGDPEIPVTNVSLPASSAENPVTSGSPVTIQGTGFTASSEIWLRASAAVKAAAEEVKTTVTSVTASSITFTAPENVSGAQTVVLKQNGGAWELGTLTFAAEPAGPEEPTDPEYLPRKVERIKVVFKDDYKGDNTMIYDFSYDTEGRLATLVVSDLFEEEEETLTIEYSYTDGKITSKGSGDGLTQSLEETYELSEGRASKYVRTMISGGKYAEDGIETVHTLNPRYDADGYLTVIDVVETCSGDPEEAYESTSEDTYTFAEGAFGKYESETSTKDSYSSYGSSSDVDFTDGPANNLNIDLFGMDWMNEEIYAAPLFLQNVGGKRSSRLPSKYKSRYVDIEEDGTVSKEDEQTIELKYTMDGDYIASIEKYREGELETTLEITYEN